MTPPSKSLHLSAFEIGVVIGIVFLAFYQILSDTHTHRYMYVYNIYIHTHGVLAENSAAAQELPFFKLAVRLCS